MITFVFVFKFFVWNLNNGNVLNFIGNISFYQYLVPENSNPNNERVFINEVADIKLFNTTLLHHALGQNCKDMPKAWFRTRRFLQTWLQ